MAQASAEKLEHTRPAEKERVASVPQSKQLASTPEPACQKEKKQSHQSKSLNLRWERVEMRDREREREPHLGE